MSQDNGQATALVPVDTTFVERQLTKMEQWEDSYKSIRHSFNVEDDAGRISYIKALSGSDAEAKRMVDRPIVVTGWLLHVVDRMDEISGEVSDGLRLCLMLIDGSTVSTGSGSLIDNWAHVARMFAAVKPWPALEIVIGAVKRTRGTGEYLQLKSIKKYTAPTPTTRK